MTKGGLVGEDATLTTLVENLWKEDGWPLATDHRPDARRPRRDRAGDHGQGPRRGLCYDALVPVVVGDRGVLEQVIEGCGLDLELRAVDAPGDARGERGAVDLIDLDNMGEVRFGEIDADHGRAALEWIERACALARDGESRGSSPARSTRRPRRRAA